MLSRPQRRVSSLLVAGLLGALAACGSDDADSQDAVSVADDTADTPVSQGAVECSVPPALPASVPTFQAGDAPVPGEQGPVRAQVQTSCGPITLDLDGQAAPQTVASFSFLAQEGYWGDSPCHRLTTEGIYVLQCGDPTGTGRGGPGYTFGIENAPSDGLYPRGTVAMARSSELDSNGGQFFIVHSDTMLPTEGGGYTIFGRVTEGMDIIDAVAAAGVDGGGADGPPAQPISITGVEIEEEATSS
ncbi:MAG: peptidylprolyl isomerase [Ornithinimicrobium sp.]|uniref:peptidylprolyl isomerase n=1 Tax=Ornithinimicrobium sp. TaxID=1977084 RepID=UPI003D9B59F8